MPFSPLDALMQFATPKRSLEPPVRNDAPGAFAPALEQAYQAESPRSAPVPQPAEQKPKTDDASASGEQHESEQPTDDAAVVAESVDGANAVADQQEESDSADGAGEDAVEIAAEAAAAVGIVQEAKGVERQVVVKSDDAETDAGDVKEVDAKGAAEAAEKQADAAADAAALQEGATEESASEGETASEEGEEVVVSTLSSTRRRQPGDQRKRDDAATRTAAAGDKSGEKKTSETPAAANAAGEEAANGEVAQVEEVVAEAPAETSSESREWSSADETAAKSEETKHQAASTARAASATDDAAVAAATASATAEASAAEVAGTSTAPVATDSSAPASDATPRTSGVLDRLMAGHALKSSKETSDPNGMPTVDRARFVQRVEGAMKAAQQRDGKIQVRLSPPDLGSIKIELAVQNGVMSAKLEAETPAARNLLLDSLPALRERLAQQDIRVEKFDVDVRREGGGNAGNGQPDERTADQSGDRQNGRPRPAVARAVALPTASPGSLVGASSAASGLDVRV
jgi:flagellar hook-length control protein FliK